ncbi:phage major capsid protein [Effusibacillus consociatus]|uniref:Phage major capsid protein n=1 Tax=Effusibacillus consociatus TaxID=1117041 RepID=A0ABV9Q3U4_9BACL
MTMTAELKQALDEMKSVWTQFQEVDKRHDEEIKKFGAATQETKEQLDNINTKLDEIEKKGQEIEKKLARSRVFGGGEAKEQENEFHAEYKNALFGGLKNLGLGNDLTPDQKKYLIDRSLWTPELKALATDNDTQAGYLVTPEYIREIIKGVVEFSPLRNLARVRQTTSKSVQIPVRTGTHSAQWTSERGTRTETTGTKYGLEDIPTHEMYADIRISRQSLEDAVFDLESEIKMEMQEQFGVAEGTAFITGSGIGQPEGVLTNTSIGEIVSGNASDITADSLISLYFELKDAYARNASWLMKRSTLKKVRQFKDSQGNYLWQPGIAGAATPATILDRPYEECVDMPAVAANAYPVVFGDFRRGYTIIDRIQITIQRLNELHAASGQIGFLGWKRVGGQVVLAEAIKKLKVAV